MDCKESIISQQIRDYILDFPVSEEDTEQVCLVPVDEKYTIAYSQEQVEEIGPQQIPFRYRYVPKLYGLMENPYLVGGRDDDTPLVVSGIKRIQRAPLYLTGKNCVICILDTGIDYTMPEFQDEYGNSRILAIWDQSDQQGTAPEGFYYGSEYKREDIENATREDRLLPGAGAGDSNGHGSRMALLAAGKNGAAPDALLVIVKLKQCKEYLREFYKIPSQVYAVQENDIMLGLKYGEKFAKVFQRPIVYCMGIGTSMGDHSGNSFLASYAARLGAYRNRCVVVCAGNEGNNAHHYEGSIGADTVGEYQDVELRVGEEEEGFCLEFWGRQPTVFRIGIRSPGGEGFTLDSGMYGYQVYSFIYEETIIEVEKQYVETNSGKEFIRFRFTKPTPGIWNFRVSILGGEKTAAFDFWLPITQFLKGETFFLTPSPEITITDPGMNGEVITVSGYNDENEGIYLEGGRGYNPDGMIRPDFAAPCVNLTVGSVRVSGTSYGAAITAGAAAQFMEWAVIRKKQILANTTQVKNYMIKGAKRKPTFSYPNKEWGYGALNMQGVFDVLAGIL